MKDKLTIRPGGTLIYSEKSTMVDWASTRILVHWSDIFHQADLHSDRADGRLRFFVPDRDNYQGSTFIYHRLYKPAQYEYINGIVHWIRWIDSGNITKSMSILDGFCKREDIRDYRLFLEHVTRLFEQNPHMKNWTKWTNKERTLFKLKCL